MKFVYSKTSFLILFVLLILLVTFNIYQLINKYQQEKQNIILHSSDQNTMRKIEDYLDKISPSFIADVQLLAKQNNLPSWGCGPSSYALAEIINKKFFDNELKIDATYNSDAYAIVERFRFAQTDDATGIDHAWDEIYFGKKMLFVDPTIGQFGKIKGIAYQEFDIGDPNIGRTLLQKYGIIDDRLTALVQKAINRIPKDQNPYPGADIGPKQLNYFISAVQDRNDVAAGKMPQDWVDWVNTLVSKYK